MKTADDEAKSIGFSALALLSGLLFTGSAAAWENGIWVKVTRPMVACTAVDDDPSLQALLLAYLSAKPKPSALPEKCRILKSGEKFQLDGEQTEKDTHVVVKMWEGVCPRGCLPTMMPVYAPPRRLVRAYLRPTDPPEGW